MISGTSHYVHEIWPLTPLSYHKNILKDTRKYGVIFKTYFFISQHSGTPKFPDFVTLSDIKNVDLFLFCICGFVCVFFGGEGVGWVNMMGPKQLVSPSVFKDLSVVGS